MYRRYVLGWLIALLVLAANFGCGTTTLERPTPERLPQTPYVTAPSVHYRSFADADALSDYLRPDSEAGPLVSAHRGGPRPGWPENAVPTFQQSLRYGPVLIETDVRITQDSVLVLMHDDTVDRTTTGMGRVDAHTLAELRQLQLLDDWGVPTPFEIDTVPEALAWAEGRAVLTLDIKPNVPPERVVRAVEQADAANRVVVIAYTLDDAMRYHRLAPDLVLSVSATSVQDVNDLLDAIPAERIIAFTGVGAERPEVWDRLREANVRSMVGTFGKLDRRALTEGAFAFVELLDQGADVLATDTVPMGMRAVRLANDTAN